MTTTNTKGKTMTKKTTTKKKKKATTKKVEIVEDSWHRATWPECSGDPKDCPENEGYGCCKKNDGTNWDDIIPNAGELMAVMADALESREAPKQRNGAISILSSNRCFISNVSLVESASGHYFGIRVREEQDQRELAGTFPLSEARRLRDFLNGLDLDDEA